jgi:site-specific recombinase XerC
VPQGAGDTIAGQQGDPLHLIDDYQQAELARKAPRTLDAYTRILRQLALWLSITYGTEGLFHPEALTQADVATYIGELRERGLSQSHLRRTLSVLNRFCNWLMTRGVLSSNPTHGVVVGTPPAHDHRGLTEVQRTILRRLVEQPDEALSGSVRGRGGDLRGGAIFALAYWAGCSVSEVSSLLASDVHLEGEAAWLHIGNARGASRSIPLREEARVALTNYLGSASRCQASAYLFTSQRERVPIPATEPDGWRLGEAALHAWWRSLKAGAAASEWPLVGAITLLDLRHDFEQRAEAAAWSPEVLSLYLGYASRHREAAGQKHMAVTLIGRPDLERKLRAIHG